MNKFIRNNYLFLILFVLIIVKEPIYKLIKIENINCNLNCEYLEEEYNKLLEFSKINIKYAGEYINTYIIYKNMYNYMNEITIRGGKDLKLNKNPVIYNNTLIGIIDEVNKNSSIVKLITNKDSKISVKINEEIGILEYINEDLVIRNISNHSNIKVGDSIYTSGLGNIRENIYIGSVANIKLDNKNIEKIISVDYDIDIKDINFVTILKETK